MDVLRDARAKSRDGNKRVDWGCWLEKAAGRGEIRAAERNKVVLGLDRPIARQRILDTAAHRPAEPRPAVARDYTGPTKEAAGWSRLNGVPIPSCARLTIEEGATLRANGQPKATG